MQKVTVKFTDITLHHCLHACSPIETFNILDTMKVFKCHKISEVKH